MTDFTSTKANESRTSRANANTSIAHQSNQTGITDNRQNSFINFPSTNYQIQDFRFQSAFQSSIAQFCGGLDTLKKTIGNDLYDKFSDQLGAFGRHKIEALNEIDKDKLIYLFDTLSENKESIDSIVTKNKNTIEWTIDLLIEINNKQPEAKEYVIQNISKIREKCLSINNKELIIEFILKLSNQTSPSVINIDRLTNRQDLDIITMKVFIYNPSLVSELNRYKIEIKKLCENNPNFSNNFVLKFDYLLEAIKETKCPTSTPSKLTIEKKGTVYKLKFWLNHINSRHTYQYFDWDQIKEKNTLMDKIITVDDVSNIKDNIDFTKQEQVVNGYFIAFDTETIDASRDSDSDSSFPVKIIKTMYSVNSITWSRQELNLIKMILH